MARRIDSATAFQNRLVRQRESEFKREQQWGTTVKYYDQMSRKNTRYEAWTSPRYYKTNNQLLEEIKKDKDKKDLLEQRREKLKQLFHDEEKTYEIEMIVRNRDKLMKAPAIDSAKSIPTQILSELNLGLKQADESKRRHEAEIKLYHSWRSNNPLIRDHERKHRAKDIKFSWLDQQIEKRLKREEDEKRHKKFLKERESRLEEQRQQDELIQQETRRKNEQLQEELEQQIAQLKLKNDCTEDLKRQENQDVAAQQNIQQLEDKLQAEMLRRRDREIALFNLKQHKLKFKAKIADVNTNLQKESELIQEMLQQDIANSISEEDKKLEIRRTMLEFLEVARQQKELEKKREDFLSFVFDSEAQNMYQKQVEIWNKEQKARENLLTDVLETVKRQITTNLEKNREKQHDLIQERQIMLDAVEHMNEQMERNNFEAQQKKLDYRKDLDDQVKENIIRKEQKALCDQKRMEEEMERIRKEEARLEKEIRSLQSGRSKDRNYGRQKTQFLWK